MKRYGIGGALAELAVELLRRIAKVFRGIWQRRRVVAGRRVRISIDATFFGKGTVVIGDHSQVGRRVCFLCEEGATIEIGANSTIGDDCILEARAGQILKLGKDFILGARSSISSVAGVEWGAKGHVGTNSHIGPREPDVSGQLRVGERVKFNRNTLIDLCAEVTFGDDVHCGPYCTLYTHNHVPALGKLTWAQPPQCAPIYVGEGAWLGHNCILLPGVNIGDHAVVAASAVVTSAVSPWAVVAGVPARLLKQNA